MTRDVTNTLQSPDTTTFPICRRHNSKLFAVTLGFVCLALHAWGQGTMQSMFEGRERGTADAVGIYTESGMRFWNSYGPQNLLLNGGGIDWSPENGTGFLQVPIGARLVFGFYTFPGTPFSLLSFDAAEFATNYLGPVSLSVVGYKGMDVTVTNVFTTDGINDGTGPLTDFQTFHLDSQFADLYRVEILSDRFSIDNVLIGGVPEPSVCALVLLGTTCAFGQSWIRSRRTLRNGWGGGREAVGTRITQVSR